MFDHLSPAQAQIILGQIRPLLAQLIPLLGQGFDIAQDPDWDGLDCSQFASEYTKPPGEICADIGSTNVTAGGLAGMCFRCVFAHYGLSLDDSFANIAEAEFLSVIERWRAILNGYLQVDARLQEIIAEMMMNNTCLGLNIEADDIVNLPSVLDRLLGNGQLLISNEWDAQPNPIGIQTRDGEIDEVVNSAYATGTSQVTIHDDQFVFAEEWNDIEYQSIEFVFIHELGHIFHNRINDVRNGDLVGDVQLTFEDGTTRTVQLLDTPAVVREYLEAVGGYYSEIRDFDYPREYAGYSRSLTNLNVQGTILFSYEANGLSFTPEQRVAFENIPSRIYTNSSGKEFVYVNQSGTPLAGEGDAVYFIEAGTYIPNFAELSDSDIITYLPNERRDTSEPKEGFADSFAAYLLAPDVLEGNPRGQFFEQNMQQWLCELLREAFQ